MTTPANYATLIAEIDVVIESYGLSLQEVFGGRSTQPTLQELIDLRYELFEVDGGGGSSDPSQIVSSTLPTTRVNPSTGLPSGGDPLQVGDRWYKPSVGQEGFWNGALWLGITEYFDIFSQSGGAAFTATAGVNFPTNSIGDTFFTNLYGDFFNFDNTAFFTIIWKSAIGITLTTRASITTQTRQPVVPVNLFLPGASIDFWQCEVTATGSPFVRGSTVLMGWRKVLN